ncbi:MAG: hypothetical protein JWN56_2173 [Sphingobacteriales bacterium]|nr:hypothetical protein [Sphingobacteriales bacterium]
MASRLLLDANVCLDFLLRRENYAETKKVFLKVFSGEVKGCVTPAIVHIVSFYLAKYYDRGLIKDMILDLLSSVKVIDCNHEITINAINSRMTDIEDALQYYTAMHHKMDYFISLDKNFIKSAIPNLPVFSPIDFLTAFDNV